MNETMISLEQFAAELKQYATDQKFHLLPKLIGPGIDDRTVSGVPISDYATTYVTSDSVILTDRFINSVLQPGRKKQFTPKENVFGFKSKRASVRPAKVDLLIDEDERMRLWKTYIGMMAQQGFDPKTFPFEAMVIDDLTSSMKRDVAFAIWHGVENTAGNNPEDVCDGYMKQINQSIADGKCTPIEVAGGLTNENYYEQMRLAVKAIPQLYRNNPNLMYISDPEAVVTYRESLAAKYSLQEFLTDYNQTKIWGRSTPFVGVDHFKNPDETLNNIEGFFTLKGNLAYLYDFDSSKANMTADYLQRDRSLAFVTDFQIGTGIAIDELVWPVVKV